MVYQKLNSKTYGTSMLIGWKQISGSSENEKVPSEVLCSKETEPQRTKQKDNKKPHITASKREKKKPHTHTK